MSKPNWIKISQNPLFPSATLAIGLALLHLTLLDKFKEDNLFSISFLMWLTLASLLWDKRHHLEIKSSLFSTVLGIVLLLLILLRNFHPNDLSLRLLPLIGGLGIILMTSGIKSIKSYWQEMVILSLPMLMKIVTIILKLIDLPVWTAKFSAFFLWMIGFKIYQDGVILELSAGRVEVYGACSGVESILLMLSVSILFLFLIPVNHLQKIICVIIAALIGFTVNALRVTILAALVNANRIPDFDYWHSSDGSLLFAIISVCIFGLYCWLAYVQHLKVPPASGES